MFGRLDVARNQKKYEGPFGSPAKQPKPSWYPKEVIWTDFESATNPTDWSLMNIETRPRSGWCLKFAILLCSRVVNSHHFLNFGSPAAPLTGNLWPTEVGRNVGKKSIKTGLGLTNQPSNQSRQVSHLGQRENMQEGVLTEHCTKLFFAATVCDHTKKQQISFTQQPHTASLMQACCFLPGHNDKHCLVR